MADAKRRSARRLALGTALLALGWLLGVWPPPCWWADHWPRTTAMMRAAGGGRRAAAGVLHPTPLADISPLLERMVIIGEDSRFRSHHGIDPAELADALGWEPGKGFWAAVKAAWRHRDHLRGASTITQQLAKNLYLSPSRSALRKLKEAATAVRLELALSKDRILELYLNVAEWGPGIWGAEAASRAYFGVPAAHLDARQAAELAATLPHPRTSNPTFRPARTLARRDLILARYQGQAVTIPAEEEERDSLAVVVPEPVVPPPLDSLRLAPAARDSVPEARPDSAP